MPRQCHHCASDEASVRRCDKRVLCEDCRQGEFKLITKTTAVQEYGLTPEVLSRLECYEVPSPFYGSMYLYLEREVQAESPACLREKKRQATERKKRAMERQHAKEMARKSREQKVQNELDRVGFPYTPELRGYLQSARPGFRRAVEAELSFRSTPDFAFFTESDVELASECGNFHRGPANGGRGTCLVLGKEPNRGVEIVHRQYDSKRAILAALQVTNDLPCDIQRDIVRTVARHEKQREWNALAPAQQRTRLLKEALLERGLDLRDDSRLCRVWIDQGVVDGYNLPCLHMSDVVRIMDQMRFIHNHPIAYQRYRQEIREIKQRHWVTRTWYLPDEVSRQAANAVCEQWDLDPSLLPIEYKQQTDELF